MRIHYNNFDEQYRYIQETACGRQACTVLIMVAFDVDAMAATRMLTQLLRSDHITYMIRPVVNFDEVKATYKTSMTADIKTIFMVNCGAINDIPKHFDLEAGGDTRVYILDNHRPFHLKNIYSRHNVVCFDETTEEYEDNDDIPSEASVMSSNVADDSDLDSLKSEEDEMDEDEDDDIDGAEELEGEGDREGEEDAEFGVDEDNADEVADDAVAGDDEAEEVPEGEEEDGGDNAGDEESKGETIGSEERSQDDEEDNEEDDDLPMKRKNRKISSLEEEDEEEVEDRDEDEDVDKPAAEVDKTFVADWSPSHGARPVEEDGDDATENGDDQQEQPDDEEDDFRLLGKRKRKENDRAKMKRQRIQQYYRRAATHASPTALMLLPHIRGKFSTHGHVPLDIIWQSIVGLTEHFQNGRIEEAVYDQYCSFLKMELGDHLTNAAERVRYSVYDTSISNLAASTENNNNNNANGTGANGNVPTTTVVQISGQQNGNIEESSEYRFYLYRHWSLYEAMKHSSYIASRFPVWKAEGREKFQELFAKMGVPLPQCEQLFPFMKPEFRSHFQRQICNPDIIKKYKFVNPGITFRSFCRFTSYKNPIAANDVVQAATALLEIYSDDNTFLPSLSNGKENNEENQFDEEGQSVSQSSLQKRSADYQYETTKSSNKELFFHAYELLGTKNESILKKGLQLAVEIQQMIAKKAYALMNSNIIYRHNRIYYVHLTNSSTRKTSSSSILTSRMGLMKQHHHHAPSSSSAGSTNNNSSNNNNNAKELEVHEQEILFARPNVLARLGQFIMEVKRNLPRRDGGWKGQFLLPLILLSERSDSSVLVMGISPFSCLASNPLEDEMTEEQKRKLLPLINFKQFFKLAAKDMEIKYRCNSFDSNVIEIQKDDAQDFIAAFDNALKKATPGYFNKEV